MNPAPTTKKDTMMAMSLLNMMIANKIKVKTLTMMMLMKRARRSSVRKANMIYDMIRRTNSTETSTKNEREASTKMVRAPQKYRPQPPITTINACSK